MSLTITQKFAIKKTVSELLSPNPILILDSRLPKVTAREKESMGTGQVDIFAYVGMAYGADSYMW
jgi:hypothetical protein